MPNREDAVKEELLQSDEDFRRLYEEHQQCERRLEELHQRSFLAQEDEVEEKQLKLRKLRLKDRMEAIARTYREGVAH